MFLKANWVIGFACMGIFYAMGKLEAADRRRKDHGLLWAALSLSVSAAVIHFLGAGWGYVLLSQIALLAAITVVRVWLDQK